MLTVVGRPASPSTRPVLTLLTGSGLAQAIALAVSPLLTRLYAPGQFGLFALYLSVVALLAVVATGRYELAIVLPEADDDAWQVGALALGLAVLFSAAALLCVWAFETRLMALAGPAHPSAWLYLLPLAVLLTSVTATLGCWENRRRRYTSLAINRTAQSGTTALASVGLGLTGYTGLGLVIGSVTGQALAAALFVLGLGRTGGTPVRPSLGRAALAVQARRFAAFPRINLPHALLDAVQATAVLALMGLVYGSVTLGLYALTLRVARTPLALFGASVAQVFQPLAAQTFNEGGDLHGLVRRTTARLVRVAVSFALAMGLAPWLFVFAFGAPWREAGVYALILAPWMALNLVTSPLSQLPLIVGRQGRAFAFGLAYQAAMLLPFALAWAFALEMRSALMLQSALASAVLVFYGRWLHRLAPPASAHV